jgi:hypothetical protein
LVQARAARAAPAGGVILAVPIQTTSVTRLGQARIPGIALPWPLAIRDTGPSSLGPLAGRATNVRLVCSGYDSHWQM